MKASEMTNEMLAKQLMSRVPLDSDRHDDLREAAARLRNLGEFGEAVGHESTREKPSQVGNAAKMREALSMIVDACSSFHQFVENGLDGHYEAILDYDDGVDDFLKCVDDAKSALSYPPRNCDRPECATTKAAQDVWRKEDGGKTAYYEWLLATATKGGKQ